jgi:hypothetical protein
MEIPPPPYNGTIEEKAAWLDVITKQANEIRLQAIAREKAKKKQQ